jgi:TetR/AcrR family transcriptional repressor of nem operon
MMIIMKMSTEPAENFEMKVSREQMAENRRRILEVASRLFRDKGFDAVSVAEVMKAAGLTHGGFYGHFSSKDDLIAQTVAHVLAAGTGEGAIFALMWMPIFRPSSRQLRRGLPDGGPCAAIRHQTPAARSAMTAGLRSQIDRIGKALPELDAADRRRAAIGSFAAMVGAVILARAIDDPALSDEVLEQTREWVDAGVNQAVCQLGVWSPWPCSFAANSSVGWRANKGFDGRRGLWRGKTGKRRHGGSRWPLSRPAPPEIAGGRRSRSVPRLSPRLRA